MFIIGGGWGCRLASIDVANGCRESGSDGVGTADPVIA
jgi:hypothetical protein